MAFVYDAGTSTPNLAGLVEIGTIRLNDGTYTLTRLGGVLDASAPMRPGVSVLPSDHGGYAGTPFYDPIDVTLEGFWTVPTLSDIWGARDLLLSTFNLANTGLQTLKVATSGWAQNRMLLVRIAGPVAIDEPVLLDKLVPDRAFSVPLVAPDPLLYNFDSQHVISVASGGTALPNIGSAPTPFVVRFNGARTDPVLTAPDGTKVKYTGTIASGHWVEVGTNPAAVGGVYAVDDTGANVYGGVSVFTARTIAPSTGGTTWTATSGSGTGTITVTYRDAWA